MFLFIALVARDQFLKLLLDMPRTIRVVLFLLAIFQEIFADLGRLLADSETLLANFQIVFALNVIYVFLLRELD